jgi:DNA invertase Pin-like site-specific DNA recombinase
MITGYVRCSRPEQDPTLQRDALAKAGCEKVFEDMVSGVRADRPGLTEALNFLRAGDILIVYRLDRLGRSLPDLLQTIRSLEQRGIGFKSLTETIDSTTASGKLIFHIFAVLADFERLLIKERTMAGLAAARARGRVGGRRPVMTPAKLEAAKKLLATNTPAKDIAKAIGVSLATYYRHVDVKAAGPTMTAPEIVAA